MAAESPANRPAQGGPDVPPVQPAGPRSDHLGPAGSPGAAPQLHRHRAPPARTAARPGRGSGPGPAGLGISPETVREQILDIIGEGKQEPAGHIPFTPRTKRVLELAVREAVQLGHLYVGTEHILLGLVREGDGVAWHVLDRLGVTVPEVRDQVLELASQDRQAAGHVIAPPGIRDYDTRIELARQAKDAAVDAKDFDRAAAARESEKELAGRAGPPDRAVVGRGGRGHAGPRARLAARRGEPAAGPAAAERHRARAAPPPSRGPHPANRLTPPSGRAHLWGPPDPACRASCGTGAAPAGPTPVPSARRAPGQPGPGPPPRTAGRGAAGTASRRRWPGGPWAPRPR